MTEIGTAIDPGIKRKDQENQDALAVVSPPLWKGRSPLLVIADGMGGYQGGALASQLVIKALRRYYRWSSPFMDPAEVLRGGIRAAHAAIALAAKNDPALENMGSTVVAALLLADRVVVANVGDSRAYYVNAHGIQQLSYDQSFVADELRSGRIRAEDLRRHPKRNVLTMAVTARLPEIAIKVNQAVLAPGDVIVLCSDGLWGPVTEAHLQRVVMELEPQPAAEKLVELANRNQGPDNISVIVART